jgi:Concanavalin A-like lectin/glucanases superfamily
MQIIALTDSISKVRHGLLPPVLDSIPMRPFRLPRIGLVGMALACSVLTSGGSQVGVGHAAELVSPGAASVPTTGLVARYLFNGDARDSSGHGHNGVKHNVLPTSDRFGHGTSAYSFNGVDSYIEIPDHKDFSVSTTGQLTISAWMRPGTLNFPHDEHSGYVHWLGKGEGVQHEWTFRMYSADNTENRANRTSFYLFNLAGGLGAGSYVQQPVTAGAWYHFVAVADMRTDRITFYRYDKSTGKQFTDQDPFINSPYQIHPQNGTAPVRVGTRDFASFFKGAIDNLYVYNRALSPAEVDQLHQDTAP